MDNKRNTVQRRLILDAVKKLNIHATAEQVYEYVFKKYPAVSKATVYRNLSQMAESGELLNVGSFYGSAHYDHNCHKHCHFVCKNCKRIYDIEADPFEISAGLKSAEGFDITDCSISFSGLCRNCKTKKN